MGSEGELRMIDETQTTQGEAILMAAQVAHEANRAWCEVTGDLSQPTWDDAPEWQRESAQQGVEYLLENPLHNPIDSHANWMAHKVTQGWVWGPVKDAEAKTHPCMVEYHELPHDQKVKDSIFHGVVWSIFERESFN